MISKLIKTELDKGFYVILKKRADRENPTSYSMCTRYEGGKVWRTPFEALSIEQAKMMDVKKYTLQHLDENERVTAVSSFNPGLNRFDEDYDEEDTRDDDEEENNPQLATVRTQREPTVAHVDRHDNREVKMMAEKLNNLVDLIYQMQAPKAERVEPTPTKRVSSKSRRGTVTPNG